MALTYSGDDFSILAHYLEITRVGPDGFGEFLYVREWGEKERGLNDYGVIYWSVDAWALI